MKNYIHPWAIFLLSILLTFKNVMPAMYAKPGLIDFIVILGYILFWIYSLAVSISRQNKKFIKFACYYWAIAFFSLVLLIPMALYEVHFPLFSVFTILFYSLFWGLRYLPDPFYFVSILISFVMLLISIIFYNKK